MRRVLVIDITGHYDGYALWLTDGKFSLFIKSFKTATGAIRAATLANSVLR